MLEHEDEIKNHSDNWKKEFDDIETGVISPNNWYTLSSSFNDDLHEGKESSAKIKEDIF